MIDKQINAANDTAKYRDSEDYSFAVNLTKKSKSVQEREKKVERQSDKIMQNILNASKLLEGRISFEQLVSLDIPTFESIVDNEFANIDASYAAFKQRGAINAYTKNETTNVEASALKQLSKG